MPSFDGAPQHDLDPQIPGLLCASARIPDGKIHHVARFLSQNVSGDARPERILSAVERPLLILLGREDLYRQFGLAEALRIIPACAPHAQVYPVERARHWLQFDRAALCNDLLAGFVD